MGIFIFWIICGVAAAVVASSKQRSGTGWFFLGILLGPFALLMVGFMPALSVQEVVLRPASQQPAYQKKCPFCAEEIKAEAIICRYCGRDQPSSDKPVQNKNEVSARQQVNVDGFRRVEMKICPSCKSEMPTSSKICTQCNHQFKKETERILCP